jgi:hypothetical protein
MTTQEFFNDPLIGGKINISVIPNGVRRVEGTPRPHFSLIFGLNILDNAPYRPVGPDGFQFMKNIMDILNKSAEGLKVFLSNRPADAIAIPTTIFFDELHHERRWLSLLENVDFKVGWHQDVRKPAVPERDWIRQQFVNRDLLFEQSDRPRRDYKTSSEGLNIVEELLVDSEERKNIELALIERERIYASIDAAARNKVDTLITSRASTNSDLDKRRNLIDTINSIYQHPRMARHYGLIHDFYLPNESATYFANDIITISLALPNDPRFQETKKTCKATPASMVVLDTIEVHRRNINEQKFYHGIGDYGLMRMASGTYKFMTMTEDRKLQRQKATSDQLARVELDSKMWEGSTLKKRVTEGISLIYLTPFQPLPECWPGVIGQNVVAAVGDEPHSLCKRLVKYRTMSEGGIFFEHKNHVEEGWIHTNVAISALSNAFDPQTIFNWSGYNLCVSKETQAHADQPMNESEKENSGAILGTYSQDEKDKDRLMREKGFKYTNHLVRESEIQLLADRSYSFLVRHVLSNGYTLPVGPSSDQDPQVTLKDLLLNRPLLPADCLFDHGRFSLDEDAINPPVIASSELYSDRATPQTASHIVVNEVNGKGKRFLFPPAINLQFGHFLRLLNKDKLGAVDIADYYDKGMEIVRRAMAEMPALPQNRDVEYLCDTRGQLPVVLPADWFTRYYLMKNGRNLVIESTTPEYPFFRYEEKGDIFQHTMAGVLNVRAGTPFQFTIATDQLAITLPDDVQLKFFIQLEVQPQAGNILGSSRAFGNAYRAFTTAYKAKVIYSLHNQLLYARGQFQVVRTIQRPPKLSMTEPKVQRPSKNADLNKVFYEFEVPDFEANKYRVSRLQLLTTYEVLRDDGKSDPSADAVYEQRRKWKNGGHPALLTNESPASVMNQVVNQVEPEVFKNEFGFRLQLSQGSLVVLAPKDDLLHFNIGVNFDIYVRFLGDGDGASVILLISGVEIAVFDIHLLADNKLTFEFSLGDQGSELTLKIRNSAGNLTYDLPTDVLPLTVLPHTDLSERNLSLLPKLEQKFLDVEDAQNKSNVLEFVHGKVFFVYRSEESARYFAKSVRLQAVGRFHEYYPGKDLEDLLSEPGDKVAVEIPNNLLPELASFKISPLLFSVSGKGVYQRSMQLMLEFDRPLLNGERFGIVLAENNSLSPSTSAIGRDLSTYSEYDFADQFLNAFMITGYSAASPGSPPYIPKYYDCLNPASPTDPTFAVNRTPYKILPLTLFFEVVKKKWIAVLAFDQEKLSANNLDAYNPFIKIVLVKFTKTSTAGNFISKLSLPTFVNILTDRVIKVIKDHNLWEISVSNLSQAKMDSNKKLRSHFVACVREMPTETNVAGPIVDSGDAPKKRYHHADDHGMIRVKYEFNRVLCVYELETFDNFAPDNNTEIEWLDDPSARLIYMAEFTLL